MKDTIPFIKTADSNLAATLLVLGFAIDGTDNSNLKRVFFYFKRTPKLEDAIDLYWRDAVKVNPKELSYARREIMTRIHEPDKGTKKHQSNSS